MAQKGCGCLPFLLAGILAAAWMTQDVTPPTVTVERFDPRSPRRPLPQDSGETFIIEDRPGGPMNSMGTAFAVDRDGVWMTAGHVTQGCTRVGLEDGRFAQPIARVIESTEADAAIVPEGPEGADALPLASQPPAPGAAGYHMGFPAGEPTIVLSELIGAADARRGRAGLTQPVLAWAERARIPGGDGPLSGISGGPVFIASGNVVGINSAATDRRGRILTASPDAMMRLTTAAPALDDRPVAYPIGGPDDAQALFGRWLDRGVIRRIFCNVNEGPGG